MVRSDAVWLGMALLVKVTFGEVRLDTVWPGTASLVKAWLGWARHGKTR